MRQVSLYMELWWRFCVFQGFFCLGFFLGGGVCLCLFLPNNSYIHHSIETLKNDFSWSIVGVAKQREEYHIPVCNCTCNCQTFGISIILYMYQCLIWGSYGILQFLGEMRVSNVFPPKMSYKALPFRLIPELEETSISQFKFGLLCLSFRYRYTCAAFSKASARERSPTEQQKMTSEILFSWRTFAGARIAEHSTVLSLSTWKPRMNTEGFLVCIQVYFYSFHHKIHIPKGLRVLTFPCYRCFILKIRAIGHVIKFKQFTILNING